MSRVPTYFSSSSLYSSPLFFRSPLSLTFADPSSLSDFSDYDSSDEEWRKTHSRKSSRHAPISSSSRDAGNYRGESFDPYAPSGSSYTALGDEGGKDRLLDDPFGDPFADDNQLDEEDSPRPEKQRMECESSSASAGARFPIAEPHGLPSG